MSDKIVNLLLEWLNDKVYSVRQAVVDCFKSILSSLGSSWVEKNLMNKVLLIPEDKTNYLNR